MNEISLCEAFMNPPRHRLSQREAQEQWRIQKILVGGGFEAQNLKNSDVFTKIESDFSAEVGNSTVFFAQIQVVSKKKKKKRSSPKLRVIFWPKSEIQTFFSPMFRWSPKKKKKKKGLHQN